MTVEDLQQLSLRLLEDANTFYINKLSKVSQKASSLPGNPSVEKSQVE